MSGGVNLSVTILLRVVSRAILVYANPPGSTKSCCRCRKDPCLIVPDLLKDGRFHKNNLVSP